MRYLKLFESFEGDKVVSDLLHGRITMILI
jgi:hypothetical protein